MGLLPGLPTPGVTPQDWAHDRKIGRIMVAAAKKTAVPAGAKVPEDHKPKAEEPKLLTVKGLLGRDWEVPIEALDDFELLDDINFLQEQGDPTRMPAVLRRLLGAGQYGAAMNLLRDADTGRVTIESASSFVMELLSGINPNS